MSRCRKLDERVAQFAAARAGNPSSILRGVLSAGFICCAAIAAVGASEERLDALGDPLPRHARARLGTIRLTHDGEQITCVAYAPDGLLLASGGDDESIRLWEADSGKPFLTYRIPGVPKCLAFSADSHELLCSTTQDDAFVCDARSGIIISTLSRLPRAMNARLILRGLAPGTAICLGLSGQVYRWDYAQRQPPQRLGSESVDPEFCVLSADCRTLITHERVAKAHRSALVLDTLDGSVISRWAFPNGFSPTRGALSPDGTTLAVSDSDSGIHFFNPRDGARLRPPYAAWRQAEFHQLRFTPDSQRLFVAASYQSQMLDVAARRVAWRPTRLSPMWSEVVDCDISPDGSRVAICGAALSIHDARDGRQRCPMGPLASTRRHGFYSPDGRYFQADNSLWSVDSAKPVAVLGSSDGGVFFARDGAPLAMALANDDRVRVRVLPSNEELTTIRADDGRFLALPTAENGMTGEALWILPSANGARLWIPGGNITSVGSPLTDSTLLLRSARCAAVAGDGSAFAAACGDSVRVWNARGEIVLSDIPYGGDEPGLSLRSAPLLLSADGNTLGVYDASESSLAIYPVNPNAARWRIAFRQQPPPGAMKLLAFQLSPNGATIAAAFQCESGVAVKAFSRETESHEAVFHDVFKLAASSFAWCLHRELSARQPRYCKPGRFSFARDISELCRACLSPDGQVLATEDVSGTITIRECATGDVLATLEPNRRAKILCFQPRGGLATTCGPGGVLLWDVDSSAREKYTAKGGLDALWEQLRNDDACTAHGAVLAMSGFRASAVSFLDERLKRPRREVVGTGRSLKDCSNPECKRTVRAIRVLYLIGSTAARALLSEIAAAEGDEAAAEYAQRALK